MALEIFKLVGSIFVDNDAANKSLSDTDKKAGGITGTLSKGLKTAGKWAAGIGTAAVAAGAALYKTASDAAANADEIDKMSQKIGISREAYQELDFVMSQNGMDVNTLQSGMKTLVNTMSSASEGGNAASEAFAALGVSVTDSDGALRKQEDVFFEAISALQGMENETERNALANELFGRSASEMAPLLNSGADSMTDLRQKAHDLGLVLSDETIDAGVSFTDTIDQTKRAFESIMTQIGADVMPLIMTAFDWVIEHMPEIKATVSQVVTSISGVIEKLMPAIEKVFEFAGILWESTLKPVLDGILTFISGVFSGDWSKIWQGIKDTFSGIWDGIKTIFKSPINAIIDGLNKFIRGVNNIKIPDWVPGVGGRGLSIREIPRLAAGGVLERGQTGFLEGNGAEAVVPLENNRRWIGAVAEDMRMAGIGGGEKTEKLLTAILGQLEELTSAGIYLDGGRLVGALAGPLDRRLGQIAAQKARA